MCPIPTLKIVHITAICDCKTDIPTYSKFLISSSSCHTKSVYDYYKLLIFTLNFDQLFYLLRILQPKWRASYATHYSWSLFFQWSQTASCVDITSVPCMSAYREYILTVASSRLFSITRTIRFIHSYVCNDMKHTSFPQIAFFPLILTHIC